MSENAYKWYTLLIDYVSNKFINKTNIIKVEQIVNKAPRYPISLNGQIEKDVKMFIANLIN